MGESALTDERQLDSSRSSSTPFTEPRWGGVGDFRRADPKAFFHEKLLLHRGHLVGAIIIGNKTLAKEVEDILLRGTPLDPAAVEGMLRTMQDAAS